METSTSFCCGNFFFFSTVSGVGEVEATPNNEVNIQSVEKQKQKMIEITAYRPSANVPMKPLSATSVPQSSIIRANVPDMTYDYKGECVFCKTCVRFNFIVSSNVSRLVF